MNKTDTPPRNVDKSVTVKCTYCGKSFKGAFFLKRHIKCQHLKPTRIIHDTRPRNVDKTGIFKCTYCDKPFKKAHFLKEHIYNQHMKPLTCTICGNPFWKTEHLKFHAMYSHGVELKEQCFNCKKVYSTRQELQNHIIDHEKEKELQNHIIDHEKEKELQNHSISYHEKIKVFICCICQRGFTSDERLKAHFETHVNRSTDCSTTISSPKQMSAHMNKDDVAAPGIFNCKYCEKNFNEPKEFCDHVKRDHTIQLGIKCNKFSLDFGTQNDSMSARHIPKRYECEFCSVKYRKKKTLLKHVNLFH